MIKITIDMEIRYYLKNILKIIALPGGFILMFLFYAEKDTMGFDFIQMEKNAAEHGSMDSDATSLGYSAACPPNVALSASTPSYSSRPLNASTVFGVRRTEFAVDFSVADNPFSRITLGENATVKYQRDNLKKDYGFGNLTKSQNNSFFSCLLCTYTDCNISVQSMSAN